MQMNQQRVNEQHGYMNNGNWYMNNGNGYMKNNGKGHTMQLDK